MNKKEVFSKEEDPILSISHLPSKRDFQKKADDVLAKIKSERKGKRYELIPKGKGLWIEREIK